MDEALAHVEGIFRHYRVDFQFHLPFRTVVCHAFLGISIDDHILRNVGEQLLDDHLTVNLDPDAEVQLFLEGFAQVLIMAGVDAQFVELQSNLRHIHRHVLFIDLEEIV